MFDWSYRKREAFRRILPFLFCRADNVKKRSPLKANVISAYFFFGGLTLAKAFLKVASLKTVATLSSLLESLPWQPPQHTATLTPATSQFLSGLTGLPTSGQAVCLNCPVWTS